MSRGKRIYVDEAEWNRVNAAAEKYRELNKNLPGLIEDVRRTARSDFERGFAAVSARQREYERSLAQSDAQLAALEKNTARRLAEHADKIAGQREEFIERIGSETGRLREETAGLLAAEHRWTQDLITVEREERRREVAALHADVTGIRDERERAARRARDLTRRTALAARYIREQLPHERYAPGRLERVEERLGQAEADLDAGLYEAVVASAGESWLRLGELRVEVETADMRWRELHSLAAERLEVLSGEVRQNRVRDGVTPDGSPDDSEVDVDRWSRGGLTSLEVRIAAERNRLGSELAPPSEEELRSLLIEGLPKLHDALKDVSQLAGAEHLAAQVRADVAVMAGDILEENGYRASGWAYQGDDDRGPLSSTVTHDDGTVIVIRVFKDPAGTPDQQDSLLELSSYNDALGNDTLRRERTRQLVARLREAGIEVRDAEEIGEPQPGLDDLDTVRATPYDAPRPQLDFGAAP